MKLTTAVVSGKIIDLNTLTQKDVNAWDIIWPLHLTNRYNGHTPRPWDVISHSMMVYKMFIAHEQYHNSDLNQIVIDSLAMLLHDAAESYIGDIISPLKQNPEFEFFRVIENNLQRVILSCFNVDYDQVNWDLVKKYDKWATSTEFFYFFNECVDNFMAAPEEEAVSSGDYVYITPTNITDFADQLFILASAILPDQSKESASKLIDLFAIPDSLKKWIDPQQIMAKPSFFSLEA